MVMGSIWAGMLILAVAAAAWNGTVGQLSGAAMEGAASAVTLALSLAGSLCLWSGVSAVMERAGLTARLAKRMRPLLRHFFPTASADETALGFLGANITANFLGLGNAATPMGIAAVKRMQTLSGGTTATDEMCLFIVINTASIQLFPTTVAALRASCGAAAPFDILPAVWLTSICSVSTGILAAKLLRRLCRA